MEIVAIQQGTPAWHEWRAGGIGSSDMAALFGLSRFKTKHELWLEKQGVAVKRKDEGSDYIKARGHVHEKTLRAYAESILDEPLAVTCIQGRRPWQRVSLDGISSDAKVVVEAKMMKREAFIELRDHGIAPREYLPQLAHQLESSDEANWVLFVGLNEKMDEKAHVFIQRGSAALTQFDTVTAGDAFWKLVESGQEPEPDDTEIVMLTEPNALALAHRYARAKAALARREKHVDELAAQIKALSGENRKVLLGELAVTRFWKKGNVDYKKVPELAGVDLEPYRKKGAFQTRIDV